MPWNQGCVWYSYVISFRMLTHCRGLIDVSSSSSCIVLHRSCQQFRSRPSFRGGLNNGKVTWHYPGVASPRGTKKWNTSITFTQSIILLDFLIKVIFNVRLYLTCPLIVTNSSSFNEMLPTSFEWVSCLLDLFSSYEYVPSS